MKHLQAVAVYLALCFCSAVVDTTAAARHPITNYHIWQPMTGYTAQQLDQALASGYDTIFLKISPPVIAETNAIDTSACDKKVNQAADRQMKLIIAILGWAGLGNGQFYDVDKAGNKIYNRLDPFWPEAMQRLEWYFTRIIDHYKTNSHIVAFAPTWGIYGEAGFTKLTAGRSRHALARFNEWRKAHSLPPLQQLPTKDAGPNTRFNRFIRFRYLYLEEKFDAMIRRLKNHAAPLPIGTWQELYPVVGYLWTMVPVPSADFALYESCFPYQTTHDPARTLAETMGFRYQCHSPRDYRNYYLPLLARKRGEGQRFMGSQLSNHYAVKSYGWSEKQARDARFDQFEDAFSPYLQKLLDEPLEKPTRDVLLIFPTYAAAALTDQPSHAIDTKFIDILLRMYGCQIVRCASSELDKLSLKQMDQFRLIIVPNASYLIPTTYRKLKDTNAVVLFTGNFARSFNGEVIPFGLTRELDGLTLRYSRRGAGCLDIVRPHPLTRNLDKHLSETRVHLPADEFFFYEDEPDSVSILMHCAGQPLLSVRYDGHFVFIHGSLFAGLAYDSHRPIPNLTGSKDLSADEHDQWGLYSSTNPQNLIGRLLVKNLLDFAAVRYRVANPAPRTCTRYLGDHIEPASISANIAYNNTGTPRRLCVTTPFKPKGRISRRTSVGYQTEITIPPYEYVALQPSEPTTSQQPESALCPASGARSK